MEITINKIAEQLKARLKKPLPGNKAHLTTRIKTKSEVTFPNTEDSNTCSCTYFAVSI